MTYKINPFNKTYKTYRIYLVLFVLLFSFFLVPTKPTQAATLSRPPSNLNLVGYWPMDEGSGTVTRNFSLNGSAGNINSATWASGKYGKALSFNGTASVNTNYDLSWNNTNFASISFWLKPDNITDYQTGIMGKNFGGYEWGFYQENAAVKLVYWDITGNHTNGMDSGWGNVLEAGKWVNLSYTWDGTTSRFYKNGVLVNTFVSTNPSLNMNRANSVMLGGNIYIWGDKYFRGALDDVRAYTRTLTATEISKMYSSGKVTGKQVANTGLVGYWSLNDGAGTRAVDSSGRGNNGTVTGATWTTGKRGKAMSFNGSSDYINFGSNTNLQLAGDLTLSAWVYPTNVDTGRRGIIISKRHGYQIGINNGNGTSAALCYEGFNGTNWNNNFCTTNIIYPNSWYHVAITFITDGQAVLYVNGVAATNRTMVGGHGSFTQNLMAGWDSLEGWGTPPYFAGKMDDIRIYNRALTATEIATLYKQNETILNASQTGKVTNGLVGYWSFNGPDYNSASTSAEVLDRSGQGNNGDNIGATVVQGKSGQGLSFNGNNNSVAIPNIASAGSAGAYSLWIKPVSTNTNQGWIDSNFDIFQWEGSLLFFRAGNQSSVSISSWQPNTWHHVVMVWDGSYYYGYLDGVQVTSGVQSGSRTGSISLGKVDAGYNFNGTIDEVRVYNRVLTNDEIQKLYNMGK